MSNAAATSLHGDFVLTNSTGTFYYLDGKETTKLMYENRHPTHSNEWVAQRTPDCPIEPMPGYIVVKPEEESSGATRLSSGLFIVSGATDKPSSAPIVAIGDNTDDDEIGFTFGLGDVVLFSIHAGKTIRFGDRGERKFLVLKASEIIGRLLDLDAKPALPTDHD
jgi:co-chaperonin GroES (HSP10)